MRVRSLLVRLAQSLVTVLVVSLVVFVLTHLSGDPAALLLGPTASEAQVVALRRELGLDLPIPVQYVMYLRQLAEGNFGTSLRQGGPALRLVLERLPATLELAAATLLVIIVVSVPLGILAGVRRQSLLDRLSVVGAVLGQSVPTFWTGLLLILVFPVHLGLFYTSGRGTWAHLVLPSLTLGLYSTARMTRLVRAGMIDVLRLDFIRTARAKGQREVVVVGRHALRNALLPVVTVLGLECGALLGGAVVTETVFAWPGVGRQLIQAIVSRDYPVVQATVMVLAVGYVLVNLAVDLLYLVIDPRIRYE